MPIGFGIGVSHAPGMYISAPEDWDALWHRLSLSRNIPQPESVASEQGDKLRHMVARINHGHEILAAQLRAYQPDLIVVVGGDQGEMFDSSNVPQLMIHLGESAIGHRPGDQREGRPAAEGREEVRLNIDVEFSRWLLQRLVKHEGFDIAFSLKPKNLGRTKDLPHAFTNPLSRYLDGLNVPTVLIYENTYNPPSLSARRCYEFGAALAKVTKSDPRRIAILGSGGLAHDPGGKRSGWLDQPLDTWFLQKLAAGEGSATDAMFAFDSDAMVGGTGEIRAWITVAGAMESMGSRAVIVDYVEAAKTATGLGFAYWEA